MSGINRWCVLCCMFNVNRNGQKKKGDTTVTFSNKNLKNAALRRSVHTPVSTTSSPDILVFKRHVIELCLTGLCAISRIATISANHRQRQPRLSPVHAVWWSKTELCWLRLTNGLRRDEEIPFATDVCMDSGYLLREMGQHGNIRKQPFISLS